MRKKKIAAANQQLSFLAAAEPPAPRHPAGAQPTQRSQPRVTKPGFVAAGSVLSQYQVPQSTGHISREFQEYGYRLAHDLGDIAHKSLYIKMAKQVDRSLLEQAWRFVSDAKAHSKAKLFMWKLKQLQQAKVVTEQEDPL